MQTLCRVWYAGSTILHICINETRQYYRNAYLREIWNCFFDAQAIFQSQSLYKDWPKLEKTNKNKKQNKSRDYTQRLCVILMMVYAIHSNVRNLGLFFKPNDTSENTNIESENANIERNHKQTTIEDETLKHSRYGRQLTKPSWMKDFVKTWLMGRKCT